MPGCQPREKKQRHGRLQVCSGSPGHLRDFPFTASGPQDDAGQPPGQARSPKSEFQFSSATRRVHIFLLRGRVVYQRDPEDGGAAHGSGRPPRTQQHVRRKRKSREENVDYKSQRPGPTTTKYKQSPGRSLQGVSNPKVEPQVK